MPGVGRSGRYFLPIVSTMPGKGKKTYATFGIPEMSEWDNWRKILSFVKKTASLTLNQRET